MIIEADNYLMAKNKEMTISAEQTSTNQQQTQASVYGNAESQSNHEQPITSTLEPESPCRDHSKEEQSPLFANGQCTQNTPPSSSGNPTGFAVENSQQQLLNCVVENAEESSGERKLLEIEHFPTCSDTITIFSSKMNCHTGLLSPTPSLPPTNSPPPTEGKSLAQSLPSTDKGDKRDPPNTNLLNYRVVAAGNIVNEESVKASNMDDEKWLQSNQAVHLLDSEDANKIKIAYKEEKPCSETELPCQLHTDCEDAKEEKSCLENYPQLVSDRLLSLMNRQLTSRFDETTTKKGDNTDLVVQNQNSDKSPSANEKYVDNLKPIIGFSAQCPCEKISDENRLLQHKSNSVTDREITTVQRPSLLEEAIFSLTYPPSIMLSVSRDSVTEGRCILRDVHLLPYTGNGFLCSREHATTWHPPVKTKPKTNFQTMRKHGSISTSPKEISKTVPLRHAATDKTSYTGTKQAKCIALMYPSSPTDSPNMHPWYRQWKITFNVKRQIIIGERRISTRGICVIATLHQLLQVIHKSSCLTSNCVTLPLEVVHDDDVDGTTTMDRDDQSQDSDDNDSDSESVNESPGGDGNQHEDKCNSSASGAGGSGTGSGGGNNNGDRDSDKNNSRDINDDDQDDDDEENDDNHPEEVESVCNELDSNESIVDITNDDDFLSSACVIHHHISPLPVILSLGRCQKTVFTENDLKKSPKAKPIQPHVDTIVVPNHRISRTQSSMVTGAIPGTKMADSNADCCCSSIQQCSRGQPTIPGILFTNSQQYGIHSQQPEVLTLREEQGTEQFHVVGPVLQEQNSEEVIVVQMDGFLQQNYLVPTKEPQAKSEKLRRASV